MVGKSFRMPAKHENLYTMAANAVVKLIIQNDIDPREIGCATPTLHLTRTSVLPCRWGQKT